MCGLATRDRHRHPTSRRHDTEEMASGEADAVLVPASAERLDRYTGAEDREEGLMQREKGDADGEDTLVGRSTGSGHSLVSHRTTLVSDRGNVGSRPSTPHTTPIPPPPVPSVPTAQSLPSSSSARRRQATDGGMRLASQGTSLRRTNRE